MPISKNLSDALDKALNPIARVFFNRFDAGDRQAFVDALIEGLRPNVDLLYIASIELDQSDREAAQRIAWLRKSTFQIGSTVADADIVGALGEWAVLRYAKLVEGVRSVSLVSLGPVAEPDLLISHLDPLTQRTIDVPYDIKTSSAVDASFRYEPARHRAKGDPHILGVQLIGTWQVAQVAHIYVKRADKLILLEEYEQLCAKRGGNLECIGSLNGNVI